MIRLNHVMPTEVMLYKIAPNWDIQTITALACTNKHYQKLIENFKGLWERTLAFSIEELTLNPLLPLLKIRDGLNKNNYINKLLSENAKLFNSRYNSSDFIRSSYPYRILTIKTYNDLIDLSPQKQIGASEFITHNLPNLVTLESDIVNVKKIITLFYNKSLMAAIIEGLRYPMLFIILKFSWNHSYMGIISILIGLAVSHCLTMDYKAKLYREADEINKSRQMEGIDIKNINEKTLQSVIDTNFDRSRLMSIILVIFIGLAQAYLYL